MKRRNVQQAFVGEPDPNQEGVAAQYEGDDAIDLAVGVALERHGHDASFATLAETAVRELAFDIPVLFDRRTYAPVTALATFRAHLEAKGWSGDQ